MSDFFTQQAAARDSLSNFAASLNVGKDKAAHDHFFIYDLDRRQVEAMYRGDWLARKVIDIVPYDMVREWRSWAGTRADVQAIEREERRLNLRKAVQRALTLGRLYGGAAIIIGTANDTAAEVASELDPDRIGIGDVKFLHVISRWQLNAPAINRDPLSPWFGEAVAYEIVAPTRGAMQIHPSRVIRFLGNEWPDPSVGASVWSDSILQTLYDAVHAVALTTTGATSLMHEAKVDVVTVPNLSEHLSSAATTAQLSARFSYAAMMKSLNNLLLLGDGETWARQKIDFAGLPQMVQTFLQVAAGAADIPVTRLLGQSPAGLSATGDSDTRNYYDMIAARQAIDLRPKLERLDQLILRSAGVDPADVSFDFRPLWQMDAAAAAQIALNKAQTTQIYAGLNLWPADVMARLVESQLGEDGVYPGAEVIFGETKAAEGVVADAEVGGAVAGAGRQPAVDFFNPDQPRDPDGRWAKEGGGGSSTSLPIILVNSSEGEEEEKQINATGGPVPPVEEMPVPTPRINLAPQPVFGPKQPSPFMSLPAAPGSPHVDPTPASLLTASPNVASALSLASPPASLTIAPGREQPWLPPTVGIGPFAKGWIPAGPNPKPTPAQQREINALGNVFGCHTCGTSDPGTKYGNWVGDHQWPTALNPQGQLQFYLPQCKFCSIRQGGYVKWLKLRKMDP